MKIIVGVQARTNSKRLPGKIYEKIGDDTLLDRTYRAASYAAEMFKEADKKVSAEAYVLGPKEDKRLESYCSQELIKVLLPDTEEDNLLSRYLLAAETLEADAIVRITSDCWLMTEQIIFEVTKSILKGSDYVSNTIFRSMPEGLDVQACSFKGLVWFNKNQTTSREHPFIHIDQNAMIRDQFSKDGLKVTAYIDRGNPAFSKTSIDTKEELERARTFHDGQKTDGSPLAGTK